MLAAIMHLAFPFHEGLYAVMCQPFCIFLTGMNIYGTHVSCNDDAFYVGELWLKARHVITAVAEDMVKDESLT